MRVPLTLLVTALVLAGSAGCAGPAAPSPAPPSAAAAPAPAAPAPPGTAAPAPAAPAPVAPGEDAALWEQLRTGTGLVVMLRHTNTEPGTGDPPGFVLEDCATQRNLDDRGREEARLLGARFTERGVRVTGVASSRYCRCLETAALLDLGPVTPRPELDSLFDDAPDTERRTALAREQVAAHRDRPGVLVLVSHQRNIAAISGVSPGTGEAVVLRSDGGTGTELVGVLPGL